MVVSAPRLLASAPPRAGDMLLRGTPLRAERQIGCANAAALGAGQYVVVPFTKARRAVEKGERGGGTCDVLSAGACACAPRCMCASDGACLQSVGRGVHVCGRGDSKSRACAYAHRSPCDWQLRFIGFRHIPYVPFPLAALSYASESERRAMKTHFPKGGNISGLSCAHSLRGRLSASA
eukprot:5867057-Pleurochrysis_carterae.AAC.1